MEVQRIVSCWVAASIRSSSSSFELSVEVGKPSLVRVEHGSSPLDYRLVVVTRHLPGPVVMIDNGATATGRCWWRISCCRHLKKPREGDLVVEPSHVTRTGNSHTLVSRQRLQFTFVGSPTLASDPCLFDKQGFHQKTRAPFTEEQETSQSSNSVHLLVDEDKRTMHAFRGTCQKGQKSSCNLTANFVH